MEDMSMPHSSKTGGKKKAVNFLVLRDCLFNEKLLGDFMPWLTVPV